MRIIFFYYTVYLQYAANYGFILVTSLFLFFEYVTVAPG
jgi:hypothetical protein